MASVFATIPQINAILEGYYSSKGKPYDNLFQSYYDENNMEQEENTFLQEEFQYDTDNPNLDELAMIHTFDDNNSIDEFLDTDFHNLYQEQTNLNIDQRRYKLLKYIYKNNKLPITTHQAAPKLNLKSKLKIKIDIEEQKRNEILDKYYHKQLSSSQLKNAQDMEYFLAIGHANDRPFLTFMVDSYTLDKINNYVQQKNDGKKANILQIQPWLDDNKFVTELKPNAPHDTVDRLKTAIKLYSTRNIPHLAFTPTILIKDDIKEIVDYLVLVPPFLKSLYNKMDIAKCGPPFTVDVSFAVKSVEMVIKNEEDEKVDVDDEDDDDFDNAYGHQNEEKEKEKEDPDKDHIGDLRERLGDNLLSYSAEDPEKKEDELYSLAAIRRILTNGYNGLRTELSEKTNDKERFDDVSYPRFKRFGIFIDRRAKKDDEMAKDDVSFYEYPKEYGTIPSDYVDEWFISVKLNCLIPGNDKIEPITALNSLCGQLLTFSFVIQAENAMKCYIMHNGQTMRFQGPSSGKLLSYLFKENNYEQYVDEKMKEFDHLMKDEKFEEFYAQMNNGYEGDA